MWSSYQEDLFKFGEAGTGNGLVVAVAGSGKTTALEELCRRLPSNKSVRYLVFNKKNADEAQVRMPSNVEAGTFHSASFAELRKSIGNTKVDGRKLYQLFRDDVGRDLLAGDRNKFESHVVRLVSLGKNNGVGILLPNNESSWRQIVSEYSIDTAFDSDADVERLIEFAENLLIASNEQTRIIDFDDMLYLPVLMDVSYPRFDVICVDEAQDTNPIQKEILKKMVGDRIFAVGDPRQAIYHFRGASSNAMDVIQHEFDCTELPLSINYRCSKEVITYAKEFCPQIEAWENAPQGSVQQLETFDPKDFQMTDAILCRTNAPNIELAYKLIRAGIPCTVLGRDIGKGLTSLVRKLAGKAGGRMPLDEFLSRLDDYDGREMQRWLAKGEEAKYQNIHDKVESIGAIADGLPEEDRNVDKLIETIDGLFSDDSRGRLTLSTIHKAKGLEWKRVFFLNRENTPPFWATKNPAQSVQEDNLIYVAYTRAKEDLFFLPKGAVK